MRMWMALFCSLALTGCGSKAASIGIIGGADGPTAVFVSSNVNWLSICTFLGAVVVIALLVILIHRNQK